MSEANQVTETQEDANEPAEAWWKTAGYGVIMLAATVGFYFYISAFEAGTESSVRIWWPVALIYNLAGKWPIVAIGTLFGVGLLGMAAKDFRKQSAS